MLISFSGLDGAGKSTLIEILKAHLEESGRKVEVMTLYDHLSFYSLLRKARDRALSPSERNLLEAQAVRDPISEAERIQAGKTLYDPDIMVRDKKNAFDKLIYGFFRSPLVRKICLLLDCIVVSARRLRSGGKRVILADRFLYDTLADILYKKDDNLNFAKFFMKLAPKPDLAVFVRVPPGEAFRRKCEYPLAYLEWRDDTYEKIFSNVPSAMVLPNSDLKEAGRTLARAVFAKLERKK